MEGENCAAWASGPGRRIPTSEVTYPGWTLDKIIALTIKNSNYFKKKLIK
jgi:hypothetical protein